MQIPVGRVSTYGALARALGDVRASRACGIMLSQNPDPPRIPCHRVVMSDGSIGGFTHPEGIKKKIERLRMEGIEVKNNKIVNFREVLFEEFNTDYPLKKLRKEQERLRSKVIIEDAFATELVGGVDVSYQGRYAFAVLVIMSSPKNIKYVIRKKVKIDFPYIPTYLAYREEPVISPLLLDLKEEILLMVDGNGIMHPRFFGLASYVGVKNNIPTIGVAKKLLVGRVVGNRVFIGERQVGFFVKSGKKKGIYISPGHKVSLKSAQEVVRRYLRYKNPEPLRLAHIYANEYRKKEL